MTKAERKTRKALSKFGLKRVPGVEQVTMKFTHYPTIWIAEPDVYQSPDDSKFIIIGTPKSVLKSEEYKIYLSAYCHMAKPVALPKPKKAARVFNLENIMEEIKKKQEEQDELVDLTGVDPTDVSLVMDQTSCTKVQAVEALRKCDNDIVNAIMELTPV
jgi:nascent polypeptide-associated complex subunit alpha